MAIVFEEQKRPINWLRIISYIAAAGFVGMAIYYLFFAASPKFEVVLPQELERATQISKIQFIDPSAVLNSPAFKRLQGYADAPSVGTLGKQDPFAPLEKAPSE